MSLWLDEEDSGVLTQDDAEFSYVGIEKLELASQYYVFERSGGLFGQISTTDYDLDGGSGEEQSTEYKFLFTTNYRGWPEIGPSMWYWGIDTEDPAHQENRDGMSTGLINFGGTVDYLVSTTEIILNRSVVQIDMNVAKDETNITFYAIEIGEYQMWLHPIEYQVTSFSLVPEPATALIAASAVLAMTQRRRAPA
ncbi:MAG: hypothetical protein AAGA92_12590 [Planctomycetota bacterium]